MLKVTNLAVDMKKTRKLLAGAVSCSRTATMDELSCQKKFVFRGSPEGRIVLSFASLSNYLLSFHDSYKSLKLY